jgi:hypothetical protein
MKSFYAFVIVAAVSLVAVRADVIGSPKALEAARRAPVAGNDVRQSFVFAGKGANIANRAVTNGTKDRDLVREQRRVVYTGKNPIAPRQIEIAPVK